MASPSRTEWPDYAVRPVMCHECGTRVILKDSWECFYDVRARQGFVRHTRCRPYRVRVVVEAA